MAPIRTTSLTVLGKVPVLKKLSLRPYNGNLYVTNSRKEYEAQHKRILKTPDILNRDQAGRFDGGEGRDGMWTYIIFASSPAVLAHELSHCLFHVFERCGMDPRDSGGEAFCYMLSQLMLEAK